MSLLPYLHRVAELQHLAYADAKLAMLAILTGEATTAQIAAFLIALRMKGETPDELFGFATAMREKATPIDPGLNGTSLVDTCGAGGGASTFNISTVSALVASAAGCHVAKHGNRSLTSLCGSADILESLGVNIALPPQAVAQSIREIGIGFLFAPAFHPAMKHAQPARAELKLRTVFNLLGPLTNPAGAAHQLIGAPSPEAAELMANALAGFEPARAFVVHGSDGLDEITTTGPTLVFEIRGRQVQRHTWTPNDFGVPTATLDVLSGGTRAANCAIARQILDGHSGPQRDIVLVNAAAALFATGNAATLRDGVHQATAAIDSGRAARKLLDLAHFSHHSATEPSV